MESIDYYLDSSGVLQIEIFLKKEKPYEVTVSTEEVSNAEEVEGSDESNREEEEEEDDDEEEGEEEEEEDEEEEDDDEEDKRMDNGSENYEGS